MNKDTKRHLISAAITFVATFAMAFCSLITDGTFMFNKVTLYAAVLAALTTAVRAVAKFIFEWASSVLSVFNG